MLWLVLQLHALKCWSLEREYASQVVKNAKALAQALLLSCPWVS
jgi:glycine/serine hydroxymethyltransferase